VLRWIVLAAVIAGVGHRVWREREGLAAYDRPLCWSWLLVAGVCYLAGLVPAAVFWWLTMRDRGAAPSFTRTFAAYFAGHLGKYVPGKGLVVVIRAGMMQSTGVPLATGAVTCAHETLLMMATGALVAAAAVLLAADFARREYLLGMSLAVGVGLGVLALPPVISRLSVLLTRPFGGTDASQSAARWRTLGAGAAMIAVGWLLMGLSLAAVLAAMGELKALEQRMGLVSVAGLLTGAVAMATVGGFVSFTPGGLGSRELILVETLGPALGTDAAVIAAVAAVLLRVVWIAAEALAAGLFWILDHQCTRRAGRINRIN